MRGIVDRTNSARRLNEFSHPVFALATLDRDVFTDPYVVSERRGKVLRLSRSAKKACTCCVSRKSKVDLPLS